MKIRQTMFRFPLSVLTHRYMATNTFQGTHRVLKAHLVLYTLVYSSEECRAVQCFSRTHQWCNNSVYRNRVSCFLYQFKHLLLCWILLVSFSDECLDVLFGYQIQRNMRLALCVAIKRISPFPQLANFNPQLSHFWIHNIQLLLLLWWFVKNNSLKKLLLCM